MDGYALRAADLEGASADNPVSLRAVGLLAAGKVYTQPLAAGQALRIMTGAPLPAGADTVVKVEETEVDLPAPESGAEGVPGAAISGAHPVRVFAQPKLGANVRLHGEEARAGEPLLLKGTLISPAAVGLLASTGNTQVQVYSRPRVAILSTGDELVDPTVKPGPGQIRNSNCYSLAATTRQAGGVDTVLGAVGDTRDDLRRTLKAAVASHDFVIISGGAGPGDFDHVSAVVQELGQLYFNKVRMRPGKAQTLGCIGGVPVFGLPGNPAAALVGFEVLIRPALLKMQGFSSLERPLLHAHITKQIDKHEQRRVYLRSRLERDVVSGEYVVTPEPNQSSALFSALHRSNCLAVLQEGEYLIPKGELVACMLLNAAEGAL
jgi:molybdopterin molybdotransferase